MVISLIIRKRDDNKIGRAVSDLRNAFCFSLLFYTLQVTAYNTHLEKHM